MNYFEIDRLIKMVKDEIKKEKEMLLITAIFIILTEAISEGLIKRYSPSISAIIFKWWVQWLIAIGLFVLWLLYALQFDNYYVPTIKIVLGFIFVRFL